MDKSKKWNGAFGTKAMFVAGMAALTLTFGLVTVGCASAPPISDYAKTEVRQAQPVAIIDSYLDKEYFPEAKVGFSVGGLLNAASQVARSAISEQNVEDDESKALAAALEGRVAAVLTKGGITVVPTAQVLGAKYKGTLNGNGAQKNFARYGTGHAHLANKGSRKNLADAVSAQQLVEVTLVISKPMAGMNLLGPGNGKFIPTVSLTVSFYDNAGVETSRTTYEVTSTKEVIVAVNVYDAPEFMKQVRFLTDAAFADFANDYAGIPLASDAVVKKNRVSRKVTPSI
ncbi:MAG: hypothetical protein Ta2B_12230 [Termitinemataceae bacterium]|nr:MAG: hypothetical protein Ta2B_12230 [Termitinemataceae bacterium]